MQSVHQIKKFASMFNAVADPGLTLGGGYISKNLYVKTKELGPLGVRRVHPLGSANVL